MGEVRRLVVSPAHRRRGLGKMLMEIAVAHARKNGMKVLELTSSAFNSAALALYENDGWTFDRIKKFRSLDLLVLRKDIGTGDA